MVGTRSTPQVKISRPERDILLRRSLSYPCGLLSHVSHASAVCHHHSKYGERPHITDTRDSTRCHTDGDHNDCVCVNFGVAKRGSTGPYLNFAQYSFSEATLRYSKIIFPLMSFILNPSKSRILRAGAVANGYCNPTPLL